MRLAKKYLNATDVSAGIFKLSMAGSVHKFAKIPYQNTAINTTKKTSKIPSAILI